MYDVAAIRRAVLYCRNNAIEITTVNIIEILTGIYLIAFGIPPVFSPNADFGRFLKRNARSIGITICGTKSVKIRGSYTTTAVWI